MLYSQKLYKHLTAEVLLTIIELCVSMVKFFVLAGLMYGLIMLLKTMLPLTNIPLFFFYVLFGMSIYGTSVFLFDKELINEIKSLKDIRKQSAGDKK